MQTFLFEDIRLFFRAGCSAGLYVQGDLRTVGFDQYSKRCLLGYVFGDGDDFVVAGIFFDYFQPLQGIRIGCPMRLFE